MNPVGKKMWSEGMTIREWSKENDFRYLTVTKVFRRERGAWCAGVSRRIMAAAIRDGYATTEYFGLEDWQ